MDSAKKKAASGQHPVVQNFHATVESVDASTDSHRAVLHQLLEAVCDEEMNTERDSQC